MKYPLRLVIPLALLVIALAVSAFSTISGFRLMDTDVEQSGLEYVAQEMSELQGRMRHDLLNKDVEAVKRDIAEKGATPDVELVLLADENNVIRYSSSLKLLGQSVHQEASGIAPTLLMQARLTMTGQTHISSDRNTIYAYYPVVMGGATGELRPSRIGILLMKYDLASMKATHRYSINRQLWWSLPFYAITFLLLGIFLHYAFNKRVLRVIAAANRFAAGDASARARLQGSDEIAMIGMAFDGMAGKISREEAERKKAQEERQKSLRLFKSVVENTPVRVFWKDTDFRYLGCNYLFARDAGFLKPEEVVGKTDFDMSWKKQAELYRADDRMVMKTQIPKLRYEEPQTTPDGKLIWLRTSKVPMHDENGQIIGVLGIYEDITEQKRSEEALRTSHEAYRNILTTTLDGFWLVDTEGRLLDANKRYAEQSGYTREELMNMRVADLEAAESASEISAHTQRTIEQGSAQFETMHRRKDGSVWHVEISALYHATDGGRFYVFMRDITGRKQAEEDLRKLNIELEERVDRRTAELYAINAELSKAKMDAESASKAKGEFLANMSHEIRTPLNAVLGMAHLLEDTPLDHRQRTYLKNIEGASSILLGVINDILDFSKIEAGRLELENTSFDLQDVMSSLSVVAAAAARNKDIDVVFQIAHDVPRNLAGDALRLGQVLVNLANNAIKFTSQGEVSIRVAVEAVSESEVLLAFSVSDTGIGMNAGQIAGLFKAFSQADASITRRFGGTGLGLAIASRLIKLMGSELAVESEYGKGSTFRFSVKLGRQSQQDMLWAQAPESLRNIRVLIVESNPVACDALHEVVQSFGWSSEVFDGDASAIEYLASEAPKSFDAVMIGMRVLSEQNLEPVRRIREQLPVVNRPRILLLSNAGNEILWKKIEGKLADAILTKPFTPSSLLDIVAELLLNSRTRQTSLQAAAPSRSGFVGAHVLVAEDNEMNQFLISELLGKWGIEVTLATNGVECLRQLETGPERFDLVLMDMQMPEMDGVEAARHIRSDPRLGRLPIVALTANVMSQDRQSCIEAGMVDFLTKPVDPASLEQVLRRHLPAGKIMERSAMSAMPNETAIFLELPGVNSAKVLQRLEGNKELYTSLLFKFFENQGGIGVRLRSLLAENGSRDEATRLAHTLKGLAATIGAEELARYAMELERCLKEGPSANSCTALLDQIETLMTPLLKAIEEIRAAHTAATPAATSQQVDKAALEKLVKKALRLLQEFNAAAEEPLEQICAALGGNPEAARAGKAFKLAAGYDYEAAAAELRQLAREMDIQV